MATSRTLQRHPLILHGGWIKLAAWSLSLALFVLLAFALSTVPWYDFATSEAPPSAARQVREFLLGGALVPGLLLLATALCIATIRRQRGQEDRYSPWVLGSMVVGGLGGGAAISSTRQVAASAGSFYPFGLMHFSQVVLLAAAALALIGLVQLFATQRSQRGRWIGAYVLVWAGAFTWIQQALLISPSFPSLAPATLELAAAGGASPWKPWPGQYQPIASIDAQGLVSIEGQPLADSSDEALIAALAGVASRMQSEEGIPDEALLVAADAHAPYRAVQRVLAACTSERVRIWKLQIIVRLEPAAHPAARDGVLHVYLPIGREVPVEVDEGLLEVPRLEPRSLDIRHGVEASGEPRVEVALGDRVLSSASESDAEDLRQRLGQGIAVRAAPDLEWQAVVRALEGPSTDESPSRSWQIDAFELLD